MTSSSRPLLHDLAARSLLIAVSTLATTGFATVSAAPVEGQNATEIVVEVVNGTTGEPGRAEAVRLHEPGPLMRVMSEVEGVQGRAVLPAASVVRSVDYLVSAVRDGVPYFGRFNGGQLHDGPVTVQVYDTTDKLEEVAVEGLSLLVRGQDALYDLEYLLTVRNESRPPETVRASPHSLELMAPPDLDHVRAEIIRGPQVEPVTVRRTGDRLALAVPLVPGMTRLRVTGSVPITGETILTVGANVPVENWSVLTTPPTLQLSGMGLERGDLEGYEDLGRSVGPPLAAGEETRLVVSIGPRAEPARQIFGDTAGVREGGTAPPQPAGEDQTGLSASSVVVAVLLVAVVALLLWRRRGRA
ncbi:MAG: hypothetical protein R6X25_07410 [Candidatus Krumholzibacteriia bacterium]